MAVFFWPGYCMSMILLSLFSHSLDNGKGYDTGLSDMVTHKGEPNVSFV